MPVGNSLQLSRWVSNWCNIYPLFGPLGTKKGSTIPTMAQKTVKTATGAMAAGISMRNRREIRQKTSSNLQSALCHMTCCASPVAREHRVRPQMAPLNGRADELSGRPWRQHAETSDVHNILYFVL